MKDEEALDEELIELQKKVNSDTHPRQTMTMDDGGKIVGWFERIVKIVHTYGIKTICLTFLTVASFITLLMFANAVNNQKIIEKWLIGQNEEHVLGNDIRKEINPKVTTAMLKLLYKLDGDRVCVLEMHNGKENPTSLPFIYCDMTYEETKENVMYISEEYSDLNMSKFSFPSYLYKNRYFIGDVNMIYEIDKKLALRLEANNVKYCGIILIRTNIDIGFLMISFLEKPTKEDSIILAELSYYVQEIGSYLDYAKQMEGKKNEL